MERMIKVISSVIVILCLFSCESNVEPEVFWEDESKSEITVNALIADDELKEVAKLIGTFVNNPEVKRELISYATEKSDFEVFQPFATMFGEENGKTSSVIGSLLREKLQRECSGCRTSTQELENLLKEGYVISAPYLAEDFAHVDEPITVSWYNGGEEGVTPGILTSKNGRLNNSVIAVDDEYASQNPTIVIIPWDPVCVPYPTCQTCTPTPGRPCPELCRYSCPPGNGRDIDCRTIGDATLQLKLPEFRLKDNLRGWPNGNYLYLHVVGGEFSRNSQGEVINTSPQINTIWNKKLVSRKNVRDKKWVSSGASFIWSNWKQSQHELRFVVDYTKGSRDQKTTVKVKMDANGNFDADSEVEATTVSKNARNMFTVGFDRCSTLASIESSGDQGKRNGLRIHYFGELMFTLDTEIY
ncbi:hypothetical protein [Marinoscillum furvescens]|uniref:Uncharacterized protein n=1 Tax=Marinoscillum furvescens DSM 4134 TaxID=1122208 RepID=A0A3D9L6S1_MARFU|nr:hypothetical protein [Marinoscillum furvescens]REE01048.1 hypothetical protein C7460_10467 [Marinoscillum furvescens DSM 4134]